MILVLLHLMKLTLILWATERENDTRRQKAAVSPNL